jgi:hypothetical protein
LGCENLGDYFFCAFQQWEQAVDEAVQGEARGHAVLDIPESARGVRGYIPVQNVEFWKFRNLKLPILVNI